MSKTERLDEELREIWELVDELGSLSEKLRTAADRTMAALEQSEDKK